MNLQIFKRLIARMNNLFEYFSVALFCLLISSVLIQVIFRYILHNPIIWIEEVIRIFFIWLVFAGSVVAHSKLLHPKVDMFIDRISDNLLKKIISVGVQLYILIFLLFLMFVSSGLSSCLKYISMPTTGLSLQYLYIIIPISTGAMIINQIKFIIGAMSKAMMGRVVE